jgi:hypothetical protein
MVAMRSYKKLSLVLIYETEYKKRQKENDIPLSILQKIKGR